MQYIIVGDTERYEGCLVTTCGNSEERAQEVLNRMIVSPTDNDLRLIKGHSNLRVKAVEDREAWWLYGTD